MPSPEYLQSEVVRLRQQLQLSREDAARAANRLSQQEAELAHLRQLLEQIRTKPSGSIVPAQHTSTRKSSMLNSTSRARTEASLHGVNSNGVTSTTRLLAQNRKPASDSQLVRTSGPSAAVTTTATTTFEELDDAMAKLEREQNELMREQARIRARLAASRPNTAVSAAQSNAHLNSNPKSASAAALSVRSPKLSSVKSNPSATNHALGLGVTRSSGLDPSSAVSNVVPYGPRVRHGPPPKPRDANSPRYAY
ncbi:unnamed protein product [Echinostoma caproni]|uniref:Similar to n=1 Tax=Echinostoma caproni TaxID=27848 RepID=A0A183B3B3_9TREM|nr:unnamed protein product [Echinostoma caproni]